MIDNFNLNELPSVELLDKEKLPTTAGIYFAVDGNNQIWYIGKAQNIKNRWANHHRYDQLTKINKKNLIKLKWYECENNEDVLTKLENYFINITVKIPEGDSYRSISAPISASTHAELEQRLKRVKKLSPLHQRVRVQR